MKFGCTPTGRSSVHWSVTVNSSLYPTPGWSKTEPGAFPTFTTSRPRSTPGYKPVGIQHCTATVISRWEGDNYRFPPYQYQEKFCLRNNQGALRLPNVQEREVIMGFPKVYTPNCVPKGEQGSQAHLDTRLTLIGNSWNVTVVAWLLSQLGARLGLNPVMTVGDIVQRTAPGCSRDLWSKTKPGAFPTFTTSRPRSTPGYKPVGIQHCTATVISRWEGDNYRFPPYQYQEKFCLRNNQGALRLPNVQEREVIMGFPKVYTPNCVPKGEQGSQAHLDTRLTLIGNSWNVTVVAWLLSQLGARLGLNPVMTVGDIVQRTAPGCSRDLQVSVQATYGQSPWIWSAGPSLGPSEKINDSGEYEKRGHFSASIKR